MPASPILSTRAGAKNTSSSLLTLFIWFVLFVVIVFETNILIPWPAAFKNLFQQRSIPEADLVIINANIWTGDSSLPYASGLAVKDGKILKVGDSQDVLSFVTSNTRVYDGEMQGFKTVVPGFIDCHMHVLMGGLSLSRIDLKHADTKEEFRAMVAEYVKKTPVNEWIIGGNWNHEQWGGEMPSRDWLDDLTPNNPMLLTRTDGHMALLNSAAFRLANITGDTQDPPGGTIVKENGEPTGILKDLAMRLVSNVVPALTPEQQDKALELAQLELAKQGVTGAHHMNIMGEAWDDLQVFERAREKGKLTTRIYFAAPVSQWRSLVEHISYFGKGDDYLRLGNLKGFVDGSLGSHTALMFDPYADSPSSSSSPASSPSEEHSDTVSSPPQFPVAPAHLSEEETNTLADVNVPAHTGLLLMPISELHSAIRGADAAGLQLSLHAIGDRANSLLLDVYERVIHENGDKDRRFRIEHAQHMRQRDQQRVAKLGVIASMQPYHVAEDGAWAEKILGEARVNESYPIRSLMSYGGRVVLGSDWFVAPPEPLLGIYYAVTRRTLDGKNPEGWVPQERIPLEAALRAYTVEGAYASFEEDKKGTLKEGMLADIVLIERDIFTQDPEKIKDATVHATIVGGKVVYEHRHKR